MKGQDWFHEGEKEKWFPEGSKETSRVGPDREGSAIWTVNFIPRAVKGQKRGLVCFLISEKSLWLCHERKGWVCWLSGWEMGERELGSKDGDM